MTVMASSPAIDPKPLIELLQRQGGECSFDDGVRALEVGGLSKDDARDVVWRLLSQGVVEFTTDRELRLPQHSVKERAAG